MCRYYQPSSQRFAPEHIPQSSVDTALSAFAQLATLRLGARRALISLIDRNNQHILAEATQTLSLQSELVHSEHDELWFGATTLPRDLGLCETALDILPPAQRGPQPRSISPLIVDDLTLDERFKYRPFVKNRPTLRFFTAMPIRTKSGFNIGTLSVYDDRPRRGLDETQKKFLDDVTITIMEHLEMTRVKAAHRRSEKMVSGLGVFVEGRSSLREWWLDTKNNKAWGPDDSMDADALSHSTGNDFVMDPLKEVAANTPQKIDDRPFLRGRLSSQDRLPTRSLSSRKPRQIQPDSGAEQIPCESKEKPKVFATNLQEDMLPANLKDMFSRASNIIRECIEVDGTIFLDASIGTFGGHVIESHRRIGESTGTGESEESVVSIGEGLTTPEITESVIDDDESAALPVNEARKERQKKCGILGFSTATKSSLTGDHAPESYVPVSEAFLQSLLQKYPRGQVFDLTEGGELVPTISSQPEKGGVVPDKILLSHGDRAKQKEAKAIVEMLPGVRSVVFSPLWDSHRERWFAGSFAWTTLSTRVLTRTEDVNYLAAFGNSIMADVARLDAVAADQAKSDFISSISHELRSPLHGILASVEFLQDTTVDLFQNSMIDTIERCGRTLLDTIQHVLDFAKINNFVKPKRKDIRTAEELSRTDSPSRPMGLSTDIDLSVVTEDVIDAMYAGYEFERNSSLAMASGFPSDGLPDGRMVDGSGMASNPSEVKKERLEIIMDIGFRQNWFFHTQSGALRRVLMNLFCNSLKYTDVGWVKVSLQAEDIASASSQLPKSKVTLTISDSGRGISEEFLHSNLFTPFIQEDAMNPGTGLGLSIVLQIVRSLGGTIDVKSKVGIGTEVKVILTLTQTPVLPEVLLAANYENPALKTRRNTSGLTLGLVGFNETDSSAIVDVKSEHSPSLKSSLERVAMLWFDIKVTPLSEWKVCPPDIYVANEYGLLITLISTPIY
jgi:signal transduction histidine kinase